MHSIWNPKVDIPLVPISIDLFQKWQYHPTVVPIKQEQRMAYILVVHANFIQVFQHFSQQGSCNACFGRSPIKTNVFYLKKADSSPCMTVASLSISFVMSIPVFQLIRFFLMYSLLLKMIAQRTASSVLAPEIKGSTV
jgi:hypothetical protein